MSEKKQMPAGANGGQATDGTIGRSYSITKYPCPQPYAIFLFGGGSSLCFSTRAAEARFDDLGERIVPCDRLTVEHSQPGLIRFVVVAGGVATYREHSGGFTVLTLLAEVAGDE